MSTRRSGAVGGVKPRRGGGGSGFRGKAVAVLAVGALAASTTGVMRSVTHDSTASAATAADTGSSASVTTMTGARTFWAAGFTGRGVDVAVIDTGVAPVAGLAAPGKVIYGPDLSLNAPFAALANLDEYGHGTHMAGLIAGNRPAESKTKTTEFKGIAPDARIVSLKVAGFNGAVDVTQVIAAINWVVQHKNDNGMNIRVLNLSFGTDSVQGYEQDPLVYAVEQAWKNGIVVVAATGNAGYVAKTGTMTNPAYSPNILAVGAADARGTNTLTDDTVALYSSTGSTARRPDLVAPGSHIVSLRAPGSTIDQLWGFMGLVPSNLFRGSGTSQAAAITSGAVALVLQQRPDLTPDQVKTLLTRSAMRLSKADLSAQGAGELDLAAVHTLLTTSTKLNLDASPLQYGLGTGTIEGSRGTSHLVFGGMTLTGERDIFDRTLSATTLAAAASAGTAWYGGTWNGVAWTQPGWTTTSNWASAGWNAPLWFDSTWMGGTWSGNTWSGSTWSGNTWSGSTWSGSTWSGNTWSGSTWSGSTWSGNTWSDNSWSSAIWS